MSTTPAAPPTEQTPKPSELAGHKDSPSSFDADARAQAREQAPITIGGATFRRRRKNWEVTRELRDLLREQERASRRTQRVATQLAELDGSEIDDLQARLDDLAADERDSDRAKRWQAKLDTLEAARAAKDEDALDAEIDDLQAQLDEATDAADDAAYRLIALLLRESDGDSPPDVDFLKAELDAEDAGDLAAALAGGGEPDPTPPTETATS